ncbi:MAG TPA: BON domain-containing protein [Burkholderiales bacterium]|nr:BON domain-containing protein [Burkholderiales bacterium]
MAQHYRQDENRDWRRENEARESENRGRQSESYGSGSNSYGGSAPYGYGTQGGYGASQGSHESQQSAFGRQGGQSGGFGAQGNQQSGYQSGGGYQGGQGQGFGQSGYSQSHGSQGPQTYQGDQYRSGYFGQGNSPNPGSHSYPGPYSGPYGHGSQGQGTQAFGQGSSGSQASFSEQGASGRYGSQGDYGVSGGYGGDRTYRQGTFGAQPSNAPSDDQLRQGMRTAYADQINYGESAYGASSQAGYGAQMHGQWPGQQGYGGGNVYQNRGQRRAPKSYQRSDERLREDIYERLIQRWDIDSTEVTVTVSAGTVTLEGTVPDRRSRHEIENIVDDAHGVKDIQNNLRIENNWSSERGQYGASGSYSSGSSSSPPQSGLSSSGAQSSAAALSASTAKKKEE